MSRRVRIAVLGSLAIVVRAQLGFADESPFTPLEGEAGGAVIASIKGSPGRGLAGPLAAKAGPEVQAVATHYRPDASSGDSREIVYTVGSVETAEGTLWWKTARRGVIDLGVAGTEAAIDLCLADESGVPLYRLHGTASRLVPECEEYRAARAANAGSLSREHRKARAVEDRERRRRGKKIMRAAVDVLRRTTFATGYDAEGELLLGRLESVLNARPINGPPEDAQQGALGTAAAVGETAAYFPCDDFPAELECGRIILEIWTGAAFYTAGFSSNPDHHFALAEHSSTRGHTYFDGEYFVEFDTRNHGRAPGEGGMSAKCAAWTGWLDSGTRPTIHTWPPITGGDRLAAWRRDAQAGFAASC